MHFIDDICVKSCFTGSNETEKRILGNNLEVSAIGLGCMGMSHAYGAPSSKKEAEVLVGVETHALELSAIYLQEIFKKIYKCKEKILDRVKQV